MFHQGKLGWRLPRPNDFSSPDLKPLRDLFGNLQQFMTWPHFGFEVDSSAYGAIPALVSITSTDDPYQLVRNAANSIQVPRDFDRWMFLGTVGVEHSSNIGKHFLWWLLNGAIVPGFADERYFGAIGVDVLENTVVMPVRKGDTLTIASAGPAGGTNNEGTGWGFFLPMG